LIRAFARLEREDLRLEIAGEGPLHGPLQRPIDDLGLARRVTLTGFVADPFAMLGRASLAVSSSRYEGFGNAIVEALACGTPVVATDCPFGPREILADGRYGALVPTGDPDALADAIVQALAATPDRTALRARAALHTVTRAADALLAIIDSIATQGHTRTPRAAPQRSRALPNT
jgi:glycosyltransferase involved in cell wall biosynthesis